MAIDGRAHLHDLGATIESLPTLLPTAPEALSVVATGADGNTDGPARITNLRPACAAPEEKARKGATDDRMVDDAGPRPVRLDEGGPTRTPLILQGVSEDWGLEMSVAESSGGGGRTRDTRLMKPLL